jgi:hypothetical protein
MVLPYVVVLTHVSEARKRLSPQGYADPDADALRRLESAGFIALAPTSSMPSRCRCARSIAACPRSPIALFLPVTLQGEDRGFDTSVHIK